MGASCTINPQVRSKKTGELVSSKLFSDLKKAVGYSNARQVYLQVRDEQFRSMYDGMLQTDENGEYTFSALKRIPELSGRLGVRKRKSFAASEAGAYAPVVANDGTIDEATQKSIEYNSKPNNEFIALPETYTDNDGTDIVQIKLVENTPENREKASRLLRGTVLHSRLKDLLKSIGVQPQVLDNLYSVLRSNGVDEYQGGLYIAEGMKDVVRRASGMNINVGGEDAFSEIVYRALAKTPIMERLVQAIEMNGLVQDIFDEDELPEIAESVNYNQKAVAELAAARLIGDYILTGEGAIELPEELQTLATLMPRVANVFRQVFSNVPQSQIDADIAEAERSPITRDDPENNIDYEEVSYNQQSGTEEFSEVTDKVKKQKRLLHDIIENNVRRYKILSSRDSDYDSTADRDMISSLTSSFQEAEYELGICDFISSSLEQLGSIEQRLSDLRENSTMSAERKAVILKNVKDFLLSYRIALDAITSAKLSGVVQLSEETDALLTQASGMIGGLLAAYEEMKNPLLISFVQRFVGTGLVVPFGKEKGKVYTAENLLEMAEKDITVFDRWLDSMAESGDLMLRMLDSTAKQARSSARLETINYKKKLDAIYLRLQKSGISDTSFMFERDPNGHKTGRYIDAKAADALDPARKRYYDEMMALKKELDAKIPSYATSLHNIVRVRKDYIERLKSQDSIDGVLRETKEALRDKVKRRSDNAEAGGDTEGRREKKNVLIDFSGREIETLPLMFVNSKDGENLDDLSEDVTSSMLMYANMCCNYSAMSNIVGLLELVREKVEERPVQQRAGAKPLVNVLEAFGISVETKLTKKGEATNIVKRMNDWFRSQVYSRYMADEGEIFGMDIGMLANLSNEVTALNQFALNILSGISNVMTASAMNRIESVCGQYFNVKSLAKADKTFWMALPDYLKDVGNPVPTSKLALFMEKFNTMQDFESDVRGQEYGRSRLSRLMTTNSLYVINNAGELWIQNRAALALGESYGLIDAQGNPISLWDSQDVVIDKDGVARLVTKPGVRKADGTAWDEKVDVMKFTNKAKSINQRMNGIYNYEDRCAAQAYSWGRMALMFRKWIKPSLNRRYSSLNYNFDVEEWEEGFYKTAGRFFLQLVNDLKRGQLDIVTSYKNLDPREQANLIRFGVEVGQFVAVVAAFAVLKDIKKKADDDDDDLAKSWWFNQMLYQTRRLESEIGSQMIINPQMLQEAFNILKSPAACVNTWEGVSNMTKLLIPSNWTTTLQTGRYKGHSKAYKLFWDSPLIPMHRTLYRGLHPQNSLQFYDL